MKIMNIIKLVGTVASVAAAVVVADKVVDKVYEKKLENKVEEVFDDEAHNTSDCDISETIENEETKIKTKKTITKAVMAVAALAYTYELALEKGVVAGAAYFTKIPTTHEDAKQMIVSPDSFETIMRDVRKVVLFG